MTRRSRGLALALLPAAVIAAGCAGARPGIGDGSGGGFDLSASVASLAATQDSLDQAERLLPLADEAERGPFRRRLAAVQGDLDRLRSESAAVARGLRESFVRGFAGLPAVAAPGVVAGIRHRPLLPALPENLVAVPRDGSLEISRTAGGPAYQACLEPPVPAGSGLALKFRLQTRWSEGGSPVPYFGIRDERGVEEALVFLPDDPDPDQVHEIYLQRAGGRLAALADGRVQTVADGRLGAGARVFFQVSGTARIVVDELRVGALRPE